MQSVEDYVDVDDLIDQYAADMEDPIATARDAAAVIAADAGGSFIPAEEVIELLLMFADKTEIWMDDLTEARILYLLTELLQSELFFDKLMHDLRATFLDQLLRHYDEGVLDFMWYSPGEDRVTCEYCSAEYSELSEASARIASLAEDRCRLEEEVEHLKEENAYLRERLRRTR